MNDPFSITATIDGTVTATGGSLDPVCEPLPVAVLILAWTPAAPERCGERLLLRGRSVELNRVCAAFPGGRLDDREISRSHARLSAHGNVAWSIADVGSKNGTFVNGRQIDGNAQPLVQGDVIRLGDTLLVFTHAMFPSPPDFPVPEYIGSSDSAREIRSTIAAYASVPQAVLITGDSGVGKEVVARSLARMCRPSGPLIEFNAANASPALAASILFGNVRGAFTDARDARPGLFRAADGGTLFLDEIGELPRDAQAQLLRVLEDGMVLPVGGSSPVKVDVRVIAATNADLRDPAVFRSDLYMRLAQLTLHVPPVRERREDIPLLVASFAGGAAFSARSLEKMMLHPWPLNVREIRGIVAQALTGVQPGAGQVELSRQVIERMEGLAARFFGDTADDMPSAVTAAQVQNALRESGGNMSAAARMVGRDRAQFYRLVKKFGLNPDDFR